MRKIACYDNAECGPMPIRFMEPVELCITRPDGQVQLVKYEAGDIIEIMAPKLQLPVRCSERWYNIPMPDGSTIEDIPNILIERNGYKASYCG